MSRGRKQQLLTSTRVLLRCKLRTSFQHVLSGIIGYFSRSDWVQIALFLEPFMRPAPGRAPPYLFIFRVLPQFEYSKSNDVSERSWRDQAYNLPFEPWKRRGDDVAEIARTNYVRYGCISYFWQAIYFKLANVFRDENQKIKMSFSRRRIAIRCYRIIIVLGVNLVLSRGRRRRGTISLVRVADSRSLEF